MLLKMVDRASAAFFEQYQLARTRLIQGRLDKSVSVVREVPSSHLIILLSLTAPRSQRYNAIARPKKGEDSIRYGAVAFQVRQRFYLFLSASHILCISKFIKQCFPLPDLFRNNSCLE